jgi:hypothetical protein
MERRFRERLPRLGVVRARSEPETHRRGSDLTKYHASFQAVAHLEHAGPLLAAALLISRALRLDLRKVRRRHVTGILGALAQTLATVNRAAGLDVHPSPQAGTRIGFASVCSSLIPADHGSVSAPHETRVAILGDHHDEGVGQSASEAIS